MPGYRCSPCSSSALRWLCMRGIRPVDGLSRAHVHGDRRLAEAACRMVSVVH
ncbi:hypothetical protein [Streptomyces sp900105755]|uniref:Uncharacterized protein n=1 Tax=Streptomyces sp. 900105755 TaxID=3154389 RepID=A0ABV1TFN7_9ACTN